MTFLKNSQTKASSNRPSSRNLRLEAQEPDAIIKGTAVSCTVCLPSVLIADDALKRGFLGGLAEGLTVVVHDGRSKPTIKIP